MIELRTNNVVVTCSCYDFNLHYLIRLKMKR